MILDDEELFSLNKGAKRYKKRDGYLTFYRFEKEYMEKLSIERPFFKDVAIRNTSIRFDFYTTATSFSFDYKIAFVEQGTLDLLVDGLLKEQKANHRLL